MDMDMDMDNAPRRAEVVWLTHALCETARELVADTRETVARSREVIAQTRALIAESQAKGEVVPSGRAG
jgi:hypothetical protein